jgi:hypothetical protein
MKTMKKHLDIAVFAIAMVLAGSLSTSCEGFFSKFRQGNDTATGSVIFATQWDQGNGISRTLRPAVASLLITQYSYSLIGPGGATASGSDATGTKSFANLAVGSWTVTVTATNSSAVVLLSGTSTFNVTQSLSSNVTVNMSAASGTGTVSLTINVPAFVTAITGTLQTEPNGTATSIDTKLSLVAGTATYTESSIASGTYRLVLSLKNAQATTVGMIIEDLDVFANVATNKTMTITAAALNQIPVAPATPAATAGDGQVTLTLTTIAGATGYNVYYGIGATAAASTTKAPGSPFANLTPIVTGLTNGTQYAFVVTAINLAGEGPASLATTAIPVAGNTGGIPRSGLVAEYLFNGTALDTAGTNNGTVNGATPAADRFLNSSSAYSFDGVSNYIQLARNSGIRFPCTISVWVNSGGQGANPSGIFASDNHDWYMGNYNGFVVSSSTAGYYAMVGCGVPMNNGYSTSVLPIPSKWTHLTVIFSSINSVIYYVDGISQSVTAAGGYTVPSFAGSPDRIGATYDSLGRTYFKGLIDDLRIYSRALTASEVSALYTEGGWTGVSSPTGLAATAGANQVSLSWTASPNATSYNVYYKANSVTAAMTDIKAPGSMITGTTATITGLTGGTQYGFVVTALNGTQESPASLAASATPTSVGGVPRNGLVAEYLFSGNALDTSGNLKNGTVNGPIAATDRFGNAGGCLYFNGTSDWVDSGFNVRQSSGSISVWFNTERIQNDMVFCQIKVVPAMTLYLSYNGTDGGAFWIRNNANTISTVVQYPQTFALNTWYQAVCIWGAGGFKFYINGSLVGQDVSTVYDDGSDANLGIGCYNGSAYGRAHYFKGKIDDFRLYSRALTDAEVTALYNENGNSPTSDPFAVTGWVDALSDNFNDGDYTSAPTWTSNGSDGYNISMSSVSGNNMLSVPRGSDYGWATAPIALGSGDFRVTWRFIGYGDSLARSFVQLFDDSGQVALNAYFDVYGYGTPRATLTAYEYDSSGISTATPAICSQAYALNSSDHVYQIEKVGSNYRLLEDGVEKCRGTYTRADQWNDNITKIGLYAHGSGPSSGGYYDDIRVERR